MKIPTVQFKSAQDVTLFCYEIYLDADLYTIKYEEKRFQLFSFIKLKRLDSYQLESH